ncbi:MAG: bifunctional 2-polyprenyl-6-hydroxyphenol methylase/3-demethylubiquinol 3-O-methyltransferase UbiG [Pseudomonadota bacterium]
MTGSATVDADEVAKFDAMAEEWWDPQGKFRPLHEMTPCRLDYITTQIAMEHDRDLRAPSPFSGLRVLDIGCGGGLLSEPMARLGAEVVGADAADTALPVARRHAEISGLRIDYRHSTAEALAADGESFDVVLAMEIVEHVAEPQRFLEACAALVAPGGLLIVSTLNKTAKSYALAIVGAERILRWLPPGTHDWQKFQPPEALSDMLKAAGLEPVDRKGMVFDPLARNWSLSPNDLSVNYAITATRPGAAP